MRVRMLPVFAAALTLVACAKGPTRARVVSMQVDNPCYTKLQPSVLGQSAECLASKTLTFETLDGNRVGDEVNFLWTRMAEPPAVGQEVELKKNEGGMVFVFRGDEFDLDLD